MDKEPCDNKLDFYNNEDNEGHIMLALHNNTDEPITINGGEHVARRICKVFMYW